MFSSEESLSFISFCVNYKFCVKDNSSFDEIVGHGRGLICECFH